MKRGREEECSYAEQEAQQSRAAGATFSPVHPCFQTQHGASTFGSISPWKQQPLVGAFQRAKPVPMKRLRDRTVPVGETNEQERGDELALHMQHMCFPVVLADWMVLLVLFWMVVARRRDESHDVGGGHKREDEEAQRADAGDVDAPRDQQRVLLCVRERQEEPVRAACAGPMLVLREGDGGVLPSRLRRLLQPVLLALLYPQVRVRLRALRT